MVEPAGHQGRAGTAVPVSEDHKPTRMDESGVSRDLDTLWWTFTFCHGTWPSRNSGYFPIRNGDFPLLSIEIVDFPIKKLGGSFHGKMLVYQRVGKTRIFLQVFSLAARRTPFGWNFSSNDSIHDCRKKRIERVGGLVLQATGCTGSVCAISAFV